MEYNYIDNVIVQIPGTNIRVELMGVSENVGILTTFGEDYPTYVFNFYEKDSGVIFSQDVVLAVGSYGWWYDENGIAIGTGDLVGGEWALHLNAGEVLQSDYKTSHEMRAMMILEDGTLGSFSGNEKPIATVEFCFNTEEAYPDKTIVDISNFAVFDTTTYSIIDGANSVVNLDKTELIIRADGDFDKFTGVKVDGELVDSNNYVASEGSTVIEFKADYLKTLDVGEHSVTVVFKDGIATTKFEVKNLDFSVQVPSRNEIRNKDGIILHTNIEEVAPDGSYVVWTSNNNNFKEYNDDNMLKIIAHNKGYTTFTATLYDKYGNELASDTVEMYSKSGFFDKIGGFFRSIFGMTKIYEN